MIRLAIAIICIFLSACASEPPRPQPPVPPTPPKQSGTKVDPPKKLADATDAWKKKNGCDKKVIPFLEIEKQFLDPKSPQRGQEFEHHFIYVACVSDAQTPIKATLSRKIILGKNSVFESTNDSFEIKSGKWEHTAKLKTPPGIKPGKYKFILSISIPNISPPQKTNELSFEIKK